MGSCCARHGQDEFFKDRFARRAARRYRKKGLGKTSQLLVELASAGGLDGATVADIGGGVGQIMLELLKAGAARGEVVELLPAYEEHARALAGEAGVAERACFRTADLVADPAAGEPADVVVMNRVVCCTPDGVELAGIAASLAKRRLVLVFPRPSFPASVVGGLQNLYFRLLRRRFRVFIHPPAAITAAAAAQGMHLALEHKGRVWQVAVFARA